MNFEKTAKISTVTEPQLIEIADVELDPEVQDKRSCLMLTQFTFLLPIHWRHLVDLCISSEEEILFTYKTRTFVHASSHHHFNYFQSQCKR